MIILGIDSSATVASAAVYKDDKLVFESFENNGLTHSVTLLPMIEKTLNEAKVLPKQIDVVAISHGPGSFTGLRIGIATAKGMASAGAKCLGVSTLKAMAYSNRDFEGIVCACMDARCNQLYNALFKIQNGKVLRLCEDRAVLIDELLEEIKNISEPILLVGDGAELFYKAVQNIEIKNVTINNGDLRYQRASGVCAAAFEDIKNGKEPFNKNELVPVYLRLPQAERELNKRKGDKK